MAARQASVAWAASAAFIIGGWAAGYVLWQPASAQEYRSYFDLYLPALTLLAGLPLAAAAGMMLGRGGGILRALGWLLAAGMSAVLAYVASFTFFGGFCLDARDVCVTTWPSRIAGLSTALLAPVVGWYVQRWAARRRSGTALR